MGSREKDKPILFASEIQPGRVSLHAAINEQATEGCLLAVVGILGDVNSGKSFLMDITAAYLQSEEAGSHGWMQTLIQAKQHYFRFDSPGQEAASNNFSTEGIYMWPQPFILEHPAAASKRVAVILLHLKTKQACPTLELFMCLICSTVIYDTTTTDVSPMFRLIESVRHTQSLLWFEAGIVKSKNLLFKQMTFLFRDVSGDIKGGKDKDLKHLRFMMKNYEENCKFQQQLDMDIVIDCFLFKPLPKYATEKAFIQQFKTFVESTVNIDDLAIKSYLSESIPTRHFNEILKLLHLEIIDPLLTEFNNRIPLLETNLDDEMDTSEKTEIPDCEMEDVSQENQGASHINNTHPCPSAEVKSQPLMKSKTSISECIESTEQNKQSPYQSVRGQLNSEAKINNDSIIEKEIIKLENWIYEEVNTHNMEALKRNKDVCKDICIYETHDKAIKKLEVFCASQKISDPADLLNDVGQRLFNKVCEIFAKLQDERDNHIMANQSQEGSVGEKLRVHPAFDEDNAMKYYNEIMETIFRSTPASTELFDQKHGQVCAEINNRISRYYVEENTEKYNVIKSMNEKLTKVYGWFADRMQKNENVTYKVPNHAREIVKCAKEGIGENLKQALANDTFLNIQANEFADSLIQKSLQECLKTYSLPEEALVEEIKNLNETTNLYELIQRVQKNLHTYYIEMNKKLQMHIFWTDDQLLKFDKSARSTFVEGSEIKLPYLQLGLNLLKEKYETVNRLIRVKENNVIMESLMLKVKNFYNEEMREISKNKMTSAKLKNIHDELKQEIHQVIMKACRYNDLNYSLLKSSLKKLNSMLDEDFEIHNEKNKRKIEIVQKTIQVSIQKAQREYNEDMTRKIGQRLLTALELASIHKECFNEKATILKIAIRPVSDDNLQSHLESLKTRTARDLEMYTEENNSRIAAKEKREEEEQRERKKQEAAAELLRRKELQRIKANNNDYLTNKSMKTTTNESNTNKSAVHTSNDDPKKSTSTLKNYNFTYVSKIPQRTSPVIAIEFGLLKIKCGVYENGKFTLINNRWGQSEFANEMAITYNDDVLIGEELRQSRGNIKQHFHLMDILMTPSEKLDAHHQLSTKIKFKGAKVSKEFICGLIFSRIKEDAETYFHQSVTSAVITVPLWYTSSQRQATKDSATIAGFTSVYLINEPTAAALSYANNENRISLCNPFLVIVANDYRIDAAVYEYNKGKVKMLHCAGDTHFNNCDTLTRVIRSIKNKNPFTGKDEEIKEIKNIVKECMKSLHEKHVNEFAVIYEGTNDGYSKKLHAIANIYGKQASWPLASCSVIVGAAEFAKFARIDEKSVRSYAKDLLPFQIKMRKVGFQKSLQICDRLNALPVTDRKHMMDIMVGREMVEYHVEELGSENHVFYTAVLQIPGLDGPVSPQNKKLNFSINSEGILQLKKHTEAQNREIIKVVWNLEQKEIRDLCSLIFCEVRKSPVFEINDEAFLESRRQLFELARILLNNLDKVSEIAKEQTEKMSESAITTANDEYSTPEEVERKIGVLTKLKSRYRI